jgi:two-component system phosphate regulon sensor histidine kinase PhoR
VTSIRGFIETLRDGAIDDPEAARNFLSILEQQSLRLGAIIDDLLTISRLEQGETADIHREESRIADLLVDVDRLCRDAAAKKGTTVRYDCPRDLVCAVNPGLLEQALTNLVQNAIRYSPEGATVAVEARTVRSAEQNRLVCVVSDNGIGIPEKHLGRIFERFYRVDKGRSREQGGTGLGLSIVRHIALAHGGTVSVSSVEGEGSVFTIDIPV